MRVAAWPATQPRPGGLRPIGRRRSRKRRDRLVPVPGRPRRGRQLHPIDDRADVGRRLPGVGDGGNQAVTEVMVDGDRPMVDEDSRRQRKAGGPGRLRRSLVASQQVIEQPQLDGVNIGRLARHLGQPRRRACQSS